MSLQGTLLAAGVCALIASAQVRPLDVPEFEVATIKPSATTFAAAVSDGLLIGMEIKSGYVRVGHMDLNLLIRTAYGVGRRQLIMPAWWQTAIPTLFDIEAKLPAGATKEQVPAMLQKLLAQRFGLQIRREFVEVDSYALTIGDKGVTFRALDLEGIDGHDQPTLINTAVATTNKDGSTTIDLGERKITTGGRVTSVRASTIKGLMDALSPRLGVPVVDKTGLNGNFDIRLDIFPPVTTATRPLTAQEALALAQSSSLSTDEVISAVERIGLRLVRQKNMMEAIAVEHMEAKPTEN